MGKYTTLKCDLCGKEVKNYKEFFRIKVQSSSFINYANWDLPFSDRKKFDLCEECVDNFLRFATKRDLDFIIKNS